MARSSSKAASPSDTLTIACRLPQGLHIQLQQHKLNLKLHGEHSPYAVGGFGLTRNVPAAQWAIIEEVFAEALWLKNGFVFAMTSPESAADKATDQKDVNAGFNPIDPEKPSATRGAGNIVPEGTPDA